MKTRINYVAVLVATLVKMVMGMVWYGAFAEPWMKYTGISEEAAKNAGGGPYAVAAIGSLLTAWLLAYVLPRLGARNFMDGVKWSFLLTSVLTLAAGLTTYSFSLREPGLAMIDFGYHVVCGVLMGGLIAAWRAKGAEEPTVRPA